MHRPVATTTPATGAHETPAPNSTRAVVGVVKIGPTENEMADFVSANTKLGIFWNGKETVDLDSANVALLR